MMCAGICKLDEQDHLCVGCGRCFKPNCEDCNEISKYTIV